MKLIKYALMLSSLTLSASAWGAGPPSVNGNESTGTHMGGVIPQEGSAKPITWGIVKSDDMSPEDEERLKNAKSIGTEFRYSSRRPAVMPRFSAEDRS